MSKQEVIVEGMHCSGCANNVKKRFESVSGVSKVEMNLDTKTAQVEAEKVLDINDLNRSLEETTYEVKEIK